MEGGGKGRDRRERTGRGVRGGAALRKGVEREGRGGNREGGMGKEERRGEGQGRECYNLH